MTREMSKPPYLPTPEEIARRAAEIREGWTEQERAKRLGFVEKLWAVPEVSTESLE